MPPGTFVPNDAYLSNEDAQVMLLTGPNMAGKFHLHKAGGPHRTYGPDRQLCAARSATIGWLTASSLAWVSRTTCTRASSTFMVEMVETASILHHGDAAVAGGPGRG